MKRYIHAVFVFVAGFMSKLLPDKIPVTFVGEAAVDELCGSIAHRGTKRVLVVTDETLVDIGLVGGVTDSLDGAGVAWAIYSGVQPDPTFDQVVEGHRRYLLESCDGVLAVGGGSSIDASKAIAAMATNGGDLARLEGKFRVRKPIAPLFAIPTTAGTGSEVTVVAVVSDTASHSKKFFIDPKLLPSMAALDPTLMAGLPPAMTAATGMDALTHAVESFIARTANDQTREYATTSVRLVFENLAKAYRDGSDLEARKGMALASYYGGLAFTRTSVGYVHAIAHNLGAHYGTPHGLANAVVLPHVLDFSRDAAASQLAELAELIGVGEGGEKERADAFIAAVRELMASVGIEPTLEAVQTADIPTIAREACDEAYLDYPVPRWMDPSDCESVIRKLVA